jgi:uncharacterized protein (TIGR02646 family)
MIRINKPKNAPDILKTKGKAKRRSHCVAYTRSPDDYITGKKSFDIDKTGKKIYGHKTVKATLLKSQHGKCFLCEVNVLGAPGDVEHFRPKAAVRQSETDKLERPGYYWLAYDWANLFFSCQDCNRIFKKHLFPLHNPDKRARSHRDNIKPEESLFINPAEENPEDFITFKCWEPHAVNDNARGEATIRMLRLNRSSLIEERRHYFDLLSIIYAVAKADPPQPETREAQSIIARALKDSAKFASMIRAAVASDFSTEDCQKEEDS